MPYGLRDRSAVGNRESERSDTPASQRSANQNRQHKRRTLKSKGCYFVWASDESVTEDESEVEAPKPKRRRVTDSLTAKRQTNAKARTYVREESSIDESSSEQGSSTTDATTSAENDFPAEDERINRASNGVDHINRLLDSFYDHFRKGFIVPGLLDRAKDRDQKQRIHHRKEDVEADESDNESFVSFSEDGNEADGRRQRVVTSPTETGESEMHANARLIMSRQIQNMEPVDQSDRLAMVLYRAHEEMHSVMLEE